MKRITSFFMFLFFSSAVFADFSVGLAEGNIKLNSDENSFGESPKIVIQDDFDNGAMQDPLNLWKISGHLIPSNSDLEFITGKSSGVSQFIGEGYNSTAEYKNLGGMTTAYLSYYFKVKNLSGEPSRNIKLARLSSGYSNKYLQPIGLTLFPNNANGIFYTYSSESDVSKVPTKWIGDYADGEWHRAEYYIILSNPAGTATGRSRITLDGVTLADYKNVITEETGAKIEWLTLPYYVDHSPGGDYQIFYDNVFLSKNLARIELCDSERYEDCTRSFIPKIISWDSRSIIIDKSTVPAIRGSYAHIFKSDGTALNRNGLKVCYACPKPPSVF